MKQLIFSTMQVADFTRLDVILIAVIFLLFVALVLHYHYTSTRKTAK